MLRRRTVSCLGVFSILGIVVGLALVSNRRQNLVRPYYDRVDRPMTLVELGEMIGRAPDRVSGPNGTTAEWYCWEGDDGVAVFTWNRDGQIVRLWWVDADPFWKRLLDHVGWR